MVITKEWLKEHRTASNAYKKVQLEAIGVDWPPTTGWQKAVIGMTIDSAQRRTFEKHSKTGGFSLYQRILGMVKKLATKEKKALYEFLRKDLTK